MTDFSDNQHIKILYVYICIFEFKLDGSADDAIIQIEEKGYAREYGTYGRKLYKTGVVFPSETGTIEEWKYKVDN